MSSFDPEDMLIQGSELLKPLLTPCGFTFNHLFTGTSSGGRASVGEFVRDRHRLELHYRWGLGIVNYHVRGFSLSHEEFMRALGAQKEAAFPTVLNKTLLGFEALLADLSRYGKPFTHGSTSDFESLALWCRNNPRKIGFGALGK